MLHELLLALSGHTGSIFVKDDSGKVQVVADFPLIHPTEETLLNRICHLATHYSRFVAFIKEHGKLPRKVDSGLYGLYLQAFCEGLRLVLNPYRAAVLDLERDLMSDPHLTPAHVQSVLEEYQQLFPALAALLDQVEGRTIHGCHLLEILNKTSESGIPIVKTAILQMMRVCHRVLYKQLSVWMLHGILADKYNEFFICKVENEGPIVQSTKEEEDLGQAGITNAQIQQMIKVSEDEVKRHYEQFSLRAEVLPSYIPARVAEKILFVGESIQMFETERDGNRTKIRGSILKTHEDIFAKELEELSHLETFSLRAFEEVIDKIRGFVAEQLWKLVVEESDLVSQLRTMKDIFLLSRGELFLAFIDQAHSLLKGPPTGMTQHYVNLSLQQAARNVLIDDEHLLNKMTLLVKASSTHQHNLTASNVSGWSALQMTYKVEWPLHILFTQSVLERYNTVFKFLLFVKRIQLELQQSWAIQMQQKHMRNSRGDTKWWLRNHMSFLVDNLQYYLQVDVIESQFSILVEKIETTQDFEAIRYAHDQFLSSLLSQTFLLMKPVSHCLYEILELCHSFCCLIGESEEDLTEEETTELESITKNFQRQSALLFKILSSVRSHQAGPHLAQLLLRIDFNKYFTNAGGQLGSIPDLSLTGQQPRVSSRRY